MTLGILYISYDDMLELMSRSRVFLYRVRLAGGVRIHLSSFLKFDDWANIAARKLLATKVAAGGKLNDDHEIRPVSAAASVRS